VIARSDQGDLLAGVGYKEGLSGAFRSTNDGENWSRMGLLDFAVTSLIESKGMLFAMAFSLGLGTGIYRSTDQGGSWELINSGLTNLSFTTLSLDSSGYLYVSTLGSGVFRSSGPITSVDDFGNTHPQDYVLEQNYPNPFNPTTQIRFQITGYEFVSIRIYDILGRHIATLMNEKKEAGFHDVTWDATGQPSGVYFYRLQAGDFVETRKLVLLR